MTEDALWFVFVTVMGAIAGFARFYSSPRKWNARYVISSMLIGSLLSLAIIGYWTGDKISENPWGSMALAIGVGYVQPPFAAFLQWMLKAKGLNIEE